MRVTLLARNTSGLQAKLRARTQRQRTAIKETTLRGLERVFTRAQDGANRDTGYMALQMRAELTHEGYNFAVGFRAEDFVGQTNTLVEPPRLITSFYPVFVVFGTRFMAGNDFLSAALRAEKQNIRRGYVRALNTR